MQYVGALVLVLFIQQTPRCLSAPAGETPATSPNSTDAATPAQVAKNAAADAQNKYNSASGLLNEINDMGTSSISSVGNAVIDVTRNLGNIASNSAGQLINTFGMTGELLGALTGGLFVTGGQIFSQLTTGIGGGLNQSAHTLGSSFKEYGNMFTNLGSSTPSVGGRAGASVNLGTRAYTWQG